MVRFIIVLTAITSAFAAAKLAQVRLGLWAFYRSRTLGKAIGAIMLPHEVRSMLVYLVDRTRRFPVTPKDEPPMSMREILSVARGTVGLIALITAGLVLAALSYALHKGRQKLLDRSWGAA